MLKLNYLQEEIYKMGNKCRAALFWKAGSKTG